MSQSAIAADLLAWYDVHARRLPWRAPPNSSKRSDPYAVWLSEVMLQQTTVKAVIPYHERFLERWPTVRDMATATEADVMSEWAGLGYYSRARNLHACARVVVEEHGGEFPRTARGLRALPGVGDYTSASIAAIAFGEPVAVVDGNVERVVSRLVMLDVPPVKAKRRVRDLVQGWVPADRPGDFAQATMDLGATICTPRKPVCALCPIAAHCEAFKNGDPLAYPVKIAKKSRPLRRGAAFVARRTDGATLLTRRPAQGLLGGTVSVPMTDWSSRQDGETGSDAAPFEANWQLRGQATHGFTHFEIMLDVFTVTIDVEAPPGMWWSDDPEREGLTTLLRRVLAVVTPPPSPS